METRIFWSSGPVAPHPRVEVTVDEGYKILGGGAFANWHGAGSLLTASYPETSQMWVAASKDQRLSDPSAISAWAIAIYDPNDNWEVTYVSRTGETAGQPEASIALPAGFSLTGGGARVNWGGAGNLLTASFPVDSATWKAQSKDQSYEDPASITVYAIGIRPRNRKAIAASRIFFSVGPVAAHPHAKVSLPPGYILTGGGAKDNWSGGGNFLTASFPNGTMSWEARGKDHIVPSPSSITVYAIGFPESPGPEHTGQ